MRPDQMTGPETGKGGFTLVEVMISICVLSIGLLAIASMQTTATQGNSHGGHVTTASAYAQGKIEELTAMEYDDADLQDTNGDLAAGLNDINEDGAAGGGDDSDYVQTEGPYTIYWNVSEDDPIDNTKTIRVIVTCPSDPVVIWDVTLNRRSHVTFDYIKAI